MARGVLARPGSFFALVREKDDRLSKEASSLASI
jgi:hypothetical protein